jgi:hypothetical protein
MKYVPEKERKNYRKDEETSWMESEARRIKTWDDFYIEW